MGEVLGKNTRAEGISHQTSRRAVGRRENKQENKRENKNVPRRIAQRHTADHLRGPADFRSRCLFICDAENLVGLALLRPFQLARVQPVDPSRLSMVCAEPPSHLSRLPHPNSLTS